MPAPTQTKFEVKTNHEVKFMCGKHGGPLQGEPTWYFDTVEYKEQVGDHRMGWRIDTSEMIYDEAQDEAMDTGNSVLASNLIDEDGESWYIIIDGTRIG